MKISFSRIALFCCLLASHSSLLAQSPPGWVRVQPRPTDDLLANPGMGWQTFHQFADQDKNLAGLPSASAYFRFYWREVQPKPDQIDFAKLDDLLAHARRAGQKLALRIMCVGSSEYLDVPAWLKEQGCRGFEFDYGGGKHWVPDFADPHFQQAHFRLIAELGRRYDGHPDLDLVDIGSVGLWGEWHMSGTTQTDTGQPVALPELKVQMAIIDAWCQAFPTTCKVIQIGCQEGMAQAAARQCGWRADCLGDMGGFSKTWNHMDNFYLQQLTNTGALETWKSGPVAFESCWDMRKWKETGWDIPYIFDYALRCHASYMNNKSAPIPPGARSQVESFLRRLGYRLAIRSIEHAATVRQGDDLKLNIDWENAGVAPPYRDYFVAIQFRDSLRTDVKPIVIVTQESIRGWLPGKRQSALWLKPAIPPGRYSYRLAVGVVDRDTRIPAVRLAIAGRDSQGWYPLSQIEIK